MISYGKQTIDQDDIESVVKVLKSDWLTQGPIVNEFENQFAKKVGAKHAVAVANGTAALHLACLAAGLNRSDIAVTSALTFIATANAPIYCGAKTNLIDIDGINLGLNLKSLKSHIEEVPKTKVILPVHYAGLACDMSELRKLVGNKIIIEDASHALGGKYEDNSSIGNCKYSEMTTFSFHPVKPITTAEGGMVTTNDDELACKLKKLRNHGVERDENKFIVKKKNTLPWYYEQQELGYNYRLSDIHAALGLSQLSKLDMFVSRRREIAKQYDVLLSDIKSIELTHVTDRERSGLHLYIIRIDEDTVGKSKEKIVEELKERGILTQVHYIPVYKQPYHAENESDKEYLNTEKFYKETLSIPIYPELTEADVQYVSNMLHEVL